jgi:hypothetical protein
VGSVKFNHGDIVLVDVNGEVSKGKALDISQSSVVEGFDAHISAGNDFSASEIAKSNFRKLLKISIPASARPASARSSAASSNLFRKIKSFARTKINPYVNPEVHTMTLKFPGMQ